MNIAQIVAALRPGAWVALTLSGGFTAHSGSYAPAVRQRGDTVELRGRIDGTIGTGGVVVATLPAGFAPASNAFCAGITGGQIAALVGIGTGSNVTITVASSTTGICLDGLTYTIV